MISKRLRFEVLKRDNYACRYCGAMAPDVALHIDHVLPVALGGSDDPTNLATACADCNTGKASTSPDAPTVDEVVEKHLRWRKAIAQASEEMRLGNPEAERIVAEINEGFHGFLTLGPAAESKIAALLDEGLSAESITRAARIAFDNPRVDLDGVIAYMFGICRSMVAELHTRARAIIAAEEVAR